MVHGPNKRHEENGVINRETYLSWGGVKRNLSMTEARKGISWKKLRRKGTKGKKRSRVSPRVKLNCSGEIAEVTRRGIPRSLSRVREIPEGGIFEIQGRPEQKFSEWEHTLRKKGEIGNAQENYVSNNLRHLVEAGRGG